MERTQERVDRENWEHCKRIAEELDRIADGKVYKCPECGEMVELEENDAGEMVCPECGAVIAPDDVFPLGMMDYFDDVLDIEYRCGSDRQYKSVCLMVACGGPNIYVDTGSKQVELYWWTDRASYPLRLDVVDAIDADFEEMFNCM